MKIKNMIKKGFTLIEMLVVVLILSVLVAIAVPKYIETVDIAMGKRAYDAMQIIYAAQLRYYADNGVFSSTFIPLEVKFPSGQLGSGNTVLTMGKFSLTNSTASVVSSGLEGCVLTFTYAAQTKTCVSSTEKGSKVCRGLGGEGPASGTGTYNLR